MFRYYGKWYCVYFYVNYTFCATYNIYYPKLMEFYSMTRTWWTRITKQYESLCLFGEPTRCVQKPFRTYDYT